MLWVSRYYRTTRKFTKLVSSHTEKISIKFQLKKNPMQLLDVTIRHCQSDIVSKCCLRTLSVKIIKWQIMSKYSKRVKKRTPFNIITIIRYVIFYRIKFDIYTQMNKIRKYLTYTRLQHKYFYDDTFSCRGRLETNAQWQHSLSTMNIDWQRILQQCQ